MKYLLTFIALCSAACTFEACPPDYAQPASKIYFIGDEPDDCLVSWGAFRVPGTQTISRTGDCSAVCDAGEFDSPDSTVEFEFMKEADVPAKCSRRSITFDGGAGGAEN
jgi:hypothetical protein